MILTFLNSSTASNIRTGYRLCRQTVFSISLVFFSLPSFALDPSAPQLSMENLANPSGPHSSQPHLSSTADSELILSWVQANGEGQQSLLFARYNGTRWIAPKTVVTLPKISDLPKVIGLTDGGLGAVWGTETKIGDMGSSEVYVSRSKDGGQTWSDALKVNSDQKVKTARYNPDIAALPKGEMAVLWSDSRRYEKFKTQLMMGAVVDATGHVDHDFAVDDDICSCCQLLPTLFQNQLYLTYRDRLPGEVRDIAVVRWPGQSSAKAVRVHQDNWVLEGCPGQGVGADAALKQFGVAWFTAAGGEGKVKVAFTEDPSSGFGVPLSIADSKKLPQGQVKLAMFNDDYALVHWIQNSKQGPMLQLALVSLDGKVLTEQSLNTPSWEADYEWPNLPVLKRAGDQVYFAWFDSQKGRIQLKSIQIHVQQQPPLNRTALSSLY